MKKIVIGLLIVSALGLIVACGGGSSASGARAETLVVAMSSDAITFDPPAQNDSYSANAMLQIYNGLVKLNLQNEIEPVLAENFEVSADGMKYTFYLRKGVKFHNGEELKAEDVVFSFARAFESPAVAHIFSAIDVSSLVAIDDYTVSFSMNAPYAGILSALCHPAAFIVNKKAVEEAGESYARNPIGTGIYKFVKHVKSNKISFERFDDYFGEKPYYKFLEMRIIPEPGNRIIELESGGADIVYDVSPNDLNRFENNADIELLRVYDYMTQYMGMNCSKAPLDDIRVRKAVACAIDTDQIVTAVWKGLGKTATAPYAPSIIYSISDSRKPIARDIEKAKKLLAEAGYADGLSLRISTNERQERIDMAVIMKEQLKDVGIDLSIEVLEWSKYIEMLEKGEQELFEIGWSSDTPDPDMVVYPCFHSVSIGAGGNYCFVNDEKLDAMIMKGRATAEGPARKQIYANIQDYLMELTPAVFQYNGEQAVGIRTALTGLELSPFGHHFLGNIKPAN